VAVRPKTTALYVTTRIGDDHRRGEVKLLKFADWRKDTKPAISLRLCEVHLCYANFNRTFVVAADTDEGTNVWVAYKDLPVRVYRDGGGEFRLVKDFYEAGRQRCLDFGRIAVDAKTEDVYVADSFQSCFRLSDWDAPRFVRCLVDAETPHITGALPPAASSVVSMMPLLSSPLSRVTSEVEPRMSTPLLPFSTWNSTSLSRTAWLTSSPSVKGVTRAGHEPSTLKAFNFTRPDSMPSANKLHWEEQTSRGFGRKR